MHGWRINVGKHDEAQCEITIRKGDEEYSYTATSGEVTKLGSQAFKKAPKDKLYWHALSRIVRFYVPEVLGSVSYTHEEIEGNPQFIEAEEVVAPEEEQDKLYDEIMATVDGLKTMDDYEKAKDSIIAKASVMSDEKRTMILKALEEAVDAFKEPVNDEGEKEADKEPEVDQETGEVKEEAKEESDQMAIK
jgi:hypothetical protein